MDRDALFTSGDDRRHARRLREAALDASQLMSARAIPVLMYHHVSPSPGLVTIGPANFRAQMAWLAAHGWRTIGADELAAFMRGEELPDKSLMLSFDDGWLDNWLYAHPVLQEFGLKAVLFLVTGWLGAGPLRRAADINGAVPAHRACMEKLREGRADDVVLRWSEARAMREAGTFEFHSHTHTHNRWDRIEPDVAVRRGKLAADLATSRTALHEQLGSASAHLCWPQGYFDDDYLTVARATGFTHFYTTRPGTCTPALSPDAIPRIVVKDRAAGWMGSRLWLYSRPLLAKTYLALQGKGAA
jgi:peptidoglycan/xylan/chitin deacetylase (PgdA/CDA1 family)